MNAGLGPRAEVFKKRAGPSPPFFFVFGSSGVNFLKKIIDCKSNEEYSQVTVPEAGKDIVQLALVGFGLVLVLFADYKNILAAEIETEGKTCQGSEN